MKYFVKLFLLIPILFYSCSNDFRAEYQKDLLYDGYQEAIDTINLKTYLVYQQGDSIKFGDLYDETTKWYDLKGYHSMTRSISHLKGMIRTSTEEITRDKYSLAVARNTLIESTGTEPLVTLSRLKKRSDGQEEWLFRHYLAPEKYLEDTSTLFYTKNKRTIYKVDPKSDTLQVKAIDIFDDEGRLRKQIPVNVKEQAPYIRSYYNAESTYIDSIISVFYQQNDSTLAIQQKDVERYTYEWNEKKMPSTKYTYRNDSLIYVTEYQYGYRK